MHVTPATNGKTADKLQLTLISSLRGAKSHSQGEIGYVLQHVNNMNFIWIQQHSNDENPGHSFFLSWKVCWKSFNLLVSGQISFLKVKTLMDILCRAVHFHVTSSARWTRCQFSWSKPFNNQLVPFATCCHYKFWACKSMKSEYILKLHQDDSICKNRQWIMNSIY